MAGDDVKHNYHLVNPSPWPLVGSATAAVMMIGAVVWMEGEAGLFGMRGPWLFFVGLGGVLMTMLGWWRDVVHESIKGENTSTVVRLGLRYRMILFIASEVMFFAAWFWAFFGAALFPGGMEPIILVGGEQMLNAEGLPAVTGNDAREIFTGRQWPPVGVTPLNPWHLPLINTLILLLSGTAVTWAHHAVVHNDQKGLQQGLIATIVLGLIFTF
ncbi:MAG: cytochrome c oxidase subunit 3, partial [Pseudomonadota bacterium]